MEIKDWTTARELDVAAAIYVHGEELKHEAGREQRDRDFWLAMFGGQQSDPLDSNETNLEDTITQSPLGRSF